jgi:hypothetical protein
MIASVEERAERRQKENEQRGIPSTLSLTIPFLAARSFCFSTANVLTGSLEAT